MTRHTNPPIQEKNTIGLDLLNFIKSLPSDLRLCNFDGTSRSYDFENARLHVPLVTALTVFFRSFSMFRITAANTAAVVASNLTYRLFEAIELRDETFDFESAYAWYLFVAAAPQLSCCRVPGLWQEAKTALNVIEAVLNTLGANRPAAVKQPQKCSGLKKGVGFNR